LLIKIVSILVSEGRITKGEETALKNRKCLYFILFYSTFNYSSFLTSIASHVITVSAVKKIILKPISLRKKQREKLMFFITFLFFFILLLIAKKKEKKMF